VADPGVVLEETDETAFWLELMRETGVFPEVKLRDLTQEVHQLISIFVASIPTDKEPRL